MKELITEVREISTNTRNLIVITTKGFADLNGKMDQMLDKQDATIGEVQGLRVDMKNYLDQRLDRIEANLNEPRERSRTFKEKGTG